MCAAGRKSLRVACQCCNVVIMQLQMKPGLLPGLGALVMEPNGVGFHFIFFSFVSISFSYFIGKCWQAHDAGQKGLLIVCQHSDIVNALRLELLDLLDESWNVAGATYWGVCPWHPNNDSL